MIVKQVNIARINNGWMLQTGATPETSETLAFPTVDALTAWITGTLTKHLAEETKQAGAA